MGGRCFEPAPDFFKKGAKMKICITSRGEALDSMVDERFGRAEKFIIYETETGRFEALDNTQNLQAMQGAGVQSAQKVIASGAKILITGHCGPKAYATLKAGGVKVYTSAKGTVKTAIEDYLKGALKEITAPDVESHW